jgi:hypothetical protein
MENLYFTVIPAKAGIHWLQELRDPRLCGDEGGEAFFDTPLRERVRACPREGGE